MIHIAVRKSLQKNKFYVHSVDLGKKNEPDTADQNAKSISGTPEVSSPADSITIKKEVGNGKKIVAKPYDDKKSVGIDCIKHSLKSARYDFIDDGQIMDDLVNFGVFNEKEAKQFRSNIEKVLNILNS